MDGGSGADRFLVDINGHYGSTETVVIRDYTPGEGDTVSDTSLSTEKAVGNDLVITLDGGDHDRVILVGHAADFLLDRSPYQLPWIPRGPWRAIVSGPDRPAGQVQRERPERLPPTEGGPFTSQYFGCCRRRASPIGSKREATQCGSLWIRKGINAVVEYQL